MPAFDTIMPAAMETISAGTCVTRPSPMVSSVKVWMASAKVMPSCTMPMMMPPMMLMKTIRRPAIASPRTNFEAPSMAPKKLDSDFELLAALAGFGLVDEAGREIGVDRHLLARHRVQGEARRDFGDAAGALGDDDEVHDHEDREHNDADDEIALRDEPPEGLDHVTRRVGALVAVRKNEPRGSHVERHAQDRGDQEDGRERAEFQRLPDEHRGHQNENGESDRKRQRKVQ